MQCVWHHSAIYATAVNVIWHIHILRNVYMYIAYFSTRFSQHIWRHPGVTYTHRNVVFCIKMLNEHEARCSFHLFEVILYHEDYG